MFRKHFIHHLVNYRESLIIKTSIKPESSIPKKNKIIIKVYRNTGHWTFIYLFISVEKLIAFERKTTIFLLVFS